MWNYTPTDKTSKNRGYLKFFPRKSHSQKHYFQNIIASISFLFIILIVDSNSATPREEMFESEPSEIIYFENYPSLYKFGDFNEDGVNDIVVRMSVNHKIKIILGETNGKFGEPTTIVTATRLNSVLPLGIWISDANGDGHLDILTGNGRLLLALLGNGQGAFRPRYTKFEGIAARMILNHMSVGDLNNDGLADIVAPAVSQKLMGVSLGSSDGSFSTPTFYPAELGYKSLIINDINDDDHLDAVAFEHNRLAVFYGNGDGTLHSEQGKQFEFGFDPGLSLTFIPASTNDDNVRIAVGGNLFDVTASEQVFERPYSQQFLRYAPTPQPMDLDADGWSDMSYAGLYWDKATKTASFGVFTLWGAPDTFFTKDSGEKGQLHKAELRLNDLDNDGKMDAIVRDSWVKPDKNPSGVLKVFKGTFSNVNSPESSTFGRAQPSSLSLTKRSENLFEEDVKQETSKTKTVEPIAISMQKNIQPIGWELVGFWEYDLIDAQQLQHGLVLIELPGSLGPYNWKKQLVLVRHEQLQKRDRRIIPVKINRTLKKVCIGAPYPTYTATVDIPGEKYDGIYYFASCKGG